MQLLAHCCKVQVHALQVVGKNHLCKSCCIAASSRWWATTVCKCCCIAAKSQAHAFQVMDNKFVQCLAYHCKVSDACFLGAGQQLYVAVDALLQGFECRMHRIAAHQVLALSLISSLSICWHMCVRVDSCGAMRESIGLITKLSLRCYASDS